MFLFRSLFLQLGKNTHPGQIDSTPTKHGKGIALEEDATVQDCTRLVYYYTLESHRTLESHYFFLRASSSSLFKSKGSINESASAIGAAELARL